MKTWPYAHVSVVYRMICCSYWHIYTINLHIYLMILLVMSEIYSITFGPQVPCVLH